MALARSMLHHKLGWVILFINYAAIYNIYLEKTTLFSQDNEIIMENSKMSVWFI